jgi:hypothetical protein
MLLDFGSYRNWLFYFTLSKLVILNFALPKPPTRFSNQIQMLILEPIFLGLGSTI